MQTVNFLFRPDVSEKIREAALATIRDWQGVAAANLLKPGAKNASVRRMAWATLADDASGERLQERIRALDGIGEVSIPSRRTSAAPQPRRAGDARPPIPRGKRLRG